MQKQSRTIEDWAASVFTDIASSGWTNALKGIWALYMKISPLWCWLLLEKEVVRILLAAALYFLGCFTFKSLPSLVDSQK